MEKANVCECMDEALKLAMNLIEMREKAEIKGRHTGFPKEIAKGRVEYLQRHGCISDIAASTILSAMESGTVFDLNTATSSLWSSAIDTCRLVV